MADSSVSGPAPSSSVLKRRKPYEDSELVGLFELFDRLPPGDERTTLSVIARDRLRAPFPRGNDQTGVAELVNGLNIEVDLGDLFGAEFYVGHCNESAVVSALCQTLPPGARVVDVGANFGLYALHAARYAGKLSRAVAFEPSPRTFGLLEANIKRNRLSMRIKARRAAVSETPGVVTFHVAMDQSFSGLRNTGRSPLREVVDVEQVSLDTDPAVTALGAVDFLKIDTEGGEAGVLAGASKTIARSPGLVVLMEYSVKNLTAQQAVDVRKGVDDLLAKGLRGWTIDLSDKAAVLKSAAQLPSTFNGSLLLAAPKAMWVDAFIAALAEAAAPAATDAALAWSAAAGLLRIVRQGQQDITTFERWSTKAGLPEGEVLGERVVKHIERLQADSKSLSARLERAETAARNEQERYAKRQESERLKLKQEEVNWYSARLEQQRRETDAIRTLAEQKDTEVTALHDKIASLRGFMNKLSDQLQAKSEDVIRLMGRREADAAARGDVESQWAKFIDALRARIESMSGELATARAENGLLEEKRLALRGHVDALNVKLEQAAALREVDAAEYMRRIAEREEALDAAQVQRARLQDLIDIQTQSLDQASASRAADMLTYQQQLGEHDNALKAAHAKQVEQQRTIASLNEKFEQSSSKWAAVAVSHRHQLSQSENALEVVRVEHASLLAAVDELKAKLAQIADEKAAETADYQRRLAERADALRAAEKKLVEMRVVIDGLNEKLAEISIMRAADITQFQRHITEREETLASLQGQHDDALAVIDELNNMLTQLASERTDEAGVYQRRLAEQEDALRAAESKRLSLRSIIDEVNGKLEQSAAMRQAAQARASELEKAVADHEEIMAALRSALTSANARADDMSGDKAADDAARKDMERQIVEMTAALDERRVQIRLLQQQLALKQLGRRA